MFNNNNDNNNIYLFFIMLLISLVFFSLIFIVLLNSLYLNYENAVKISETVEKTNYVLDDVIKNILN